MKALKYSTKSAILAIASKTAYSIVAVRGHALLLALFTELFMIYSFLKI
jgi:hypothetical protein